MTNPKSKPVTIRELAGMCQPPRCIGAVSHTVRRLAQEPRAARHIYKLGHAWMIDRTFAVSLAANWQSVVSARRGNRGPKRGHRPRKIPQPDL